MKNTFALLLCFLCVGSLAAQESAEPSLSFAVSGSVSPSGRFLNLRLRVGENMSQSLRIFSEPSHTPVATYVDNRGGDPRNAAWYHDVTMSSLHAPVMELPFASGAVGTFQVPIPPASDTYFTCVIHGWWPDAGQEQDTIVPVHVDMQKFGFDFRRVRQYLVVCCTLDPDHASNTCANACSKCPGNAVSCCYKEGYDPVCGWCGKMQALCGGDLCSGC